METFSALLALCAGNSPVPGEIPSQRLVTRSFDVFFDLRLNKRLSKQSWGWWFETPSCSLWRHCNVFVPWHCAYAYVLIGLQWGVKQFSIKHVSNDNWICTILGCFDTTKISNNYRFDIIPGFFNTLGPFLFRCISFNSAWISNYIHYKVWTEMTYPFPNCNGLIPHFTGHLITYPCWD